MAQYRFSNPTSLYRILESITAFVAHGEMNAALERAVNVHDEGLYQTAAAAGAGKLLWRTFTSHADELLIAIRASDPEGCVEAVMDLTETLTSIVESQS
jgi:hypothetical protein